MLSYSGKETDGESKARSVDHLHEHYDDEGKTGESSVNDDGSIDANESDHEQTGDGHDKKGSDNNMSSCDGSVNSGQMDLMDENKRQRLLEKNRIRARERRKRQKNERLGAKDNLSRLIKDNEDLKRGNALLKQKVAEAEQKLNNLLQEEKMILGQAQLSQSGKLASNMPGGISGTIPGMPMNMSYGMLPNMQGMPVNMQGMPVNMQGMPVNMQGMPVNIQGMPVNMQGMAGNLQAMPSNIQAMPGGMQLISGPIPGNMQVMSGGMQGNVQSVTGNMQILPSGAATGFPLPSPVSQTPNNDKPASTPVQQVTKVAQPVSSNAQNNAGDSKSQISALQNPNVNQIFSSASPFVGPYFPGQVGNMNVGGVSQLGIGGLMTPGSVGSGVNASVGPSVPCTNLQATGVGVNEAENQAKSGTVVEAQAPMIGVGGPGFSSAPGHMGTGQLQLFMNYLQSQNTSSGVTPNITTNAGAGGQTSKPSSSGPSSEPNANPAARNLNVSGGSNSITPFNTMVGGGIGNMNMGMSGMNMGMGIPGVNIGIPALNIGGMGNQMPNNGFGGGFQTMMGSMTPMSWQGGYPGINNVSSSNQVVIQGKQSGSGSIVEKPETTADV